MKALEVSLSQRFVDRMQLLTPQSSHHIWLGLVVAPETRTSGFVEVVEQYELMQKSQFLWRVGMSNMTSCELPKYHQVSAVCRKNDIYQKSPCASH